MKSSRWLVLLLCLLTIGGSGLWLWRSARRAPPVLEPPRLAAGQAFAEGERLHQLADRGALEDAVESYERALDLFREARDPEQEALVLQRLGQTWQELGESQTALDCFERALERLEELELPSQTAALLNDLGVVARRLGRSQRAVEAYEQALEIGRHSGDREAETTALNNLALIYRSRLDLQQALRLYDRALAGWRQLDDRAGEASTLHNIGVCYTLLDMLPEALDALRRALDRRAPDDRRGRAATLTAIGWVYFWSDEPERALAVYEQAIALRRAVGDRRGEAVTLDRQGTALLKLRRGREARAAYVRALAIFSEVEDRRSEAHTLSNLGLAHAALDEPQQAMAQYRAARGLFQQMEDRSGEAAVLLRMARSERDRGHLEAARKELEKALERVEPPPESAFDPAYHTSYFAAMHELFDFQVDLLIDFYRRQPDGGYDVEVLEAAERHRLRILRRMVAQAPSSASAPRIGERESAVRREIEEAEQERLRWVDDPARQGALEVAEARLRDLILELDQIRAERFVDRPRAHPEPLSVRQIQEQLLDHDTLLLAFLLGEEKSFLVVVERDAVTGLELAPRARLEEQARRAHALLSQSDRRGLKTQARLAVAALGEELLGPVADKLDHQRLLVVADGVLQVIPFAALPKPASEGPSVRPPPLVADHELIHLPSASVLAAIRRQLAGRRPAQRTLAVIADPIFSHDDPRLDDVSADTAEEAETVDGAAFDGLSRFRRLPHAEREAEAILALVSEDQSLRALGFEASRALVLSRRLTSYRILHFVTHGFLHPSHPELAGLALSQVDREGRTQNGFLRAHEISRLHLPAELVVLSACRTALGKKIHGEGLVGLPHAFLQAGAASVLVSLWPVDDEATAELMQRFYHGLLVEGEGPAEALRRAQLWLRDEERWQAPYYWAAFVLQGEWRSRL